MPGVVPKQLIIPYIVPAKLGAKSCELAKLEDVAAPLKPNEMVIMATHTIGSRPQKAKTMSIMPGSTCAERITYYMIIVQESFIISTYRVCKTSFWWVLPSTNPFDESSLQWNRMQMQPRDEQCVVNWTGSRPWTGRIQGLRSRTWVLPLLGKIDPTCFRNAAR